MELTQLVKRISGYAALLRNQPRPKRCSLYSGWPSCEPRMASPWVHYQVLLKRTLLGLFYDIRAHQSWVMLLLLVVLWVIDLRESKTTNCSTSTRTGKSTLQGKICAVLQSWASISARTGACWSHYTSLFSPRLMVRWLCQAAELRWFWPAKATQSAFPPQWKSGFIL